MKKSDGSVLFSLVSILLFSSMICASFQIGNLSDSIKTTYGQSEKLSGWINISILQESSTSKLTDSFGDNISLNDVLQINKDAGYLSYNCNIKNCSVSDYSATNPQKEKTFSLIAGQEKIIGIDIIDNGVRNVNSTSFILDSNAPSSCTNQIDIDIGNGAAKIQNNKINPSLCEDSKSYGCYDNSIQTRLSLLDSTNSYCERINLLPHPGFQIGAWIQKVSGAEDVLISLKNIKSGEISDPTCNISNSQLSGSGSEVGCQLNYSVKTQGDYYVCVRKTDGSGEIYIKGYSAGATTYCGYYNEVGKTKTSEGSAYDIFAQGNMYDQVGTLNVENNLTGVLLGPAISNYLNDIYRYQIKDGKINCSLGCIVPIKITSNVDQQIKIRNLSAKYKSSEGEFPPETNFYDLTKTSPLVSTNGFVQMYLDNLNFQIPNDVGNKTLTIKLGDTQLISKQITIQSIPTISYIFPDTTSSAYPTKFTVYANASSGSISSYLWEFGDGTNATTSTNQVEHTFNDTQTYTLKVTVRDSSLRTASKEFNILVTSPDQAITKTYGELRNNLANVNLQLASYPKFLQDQITAALNLTSLSTQMDIYERNMRNINGSTLEEKNNFLVGLLNLNIPKSIFVSYNIENLTFFPDTNNINLDIIKETGGTYDATKTEQYKNAILTWQQQNIEIKIDYKEISAFYATGNSRVLSYFKVQANQKTTGDYRYLFLKKIGGLKFDGDPILKGNADYDYIELKDKQEILTFTTSEDVNFLTLPIFVSPILTALTITEDLTPKGQGPIYGNINWVLFSLAVLFILILGFIVYLILQEWYKSKYENYLFKGKNNMYNLINFIESQKRQGINDEEIEHKLKQSGWNWEQIKYVTRKYSGKRTGMVEIPVKNIFEKNSIAPNPKAYPNKQITPNKVNPYGMSQKRDFLKR